MKKAKVCGEKISHGGSTITQQGIVRLRLKKEVD